MSSAYLPISATIINEKVYQGLASNSEKLGSFTHGFTYSGHPVCAAVALETLKIYEERDIIGHVRTVAPRFQAGLRRLLDHPLVGDVRGVGLMAGLELVRDKATKQSFDAKAGVGAFFEKCAHAQGLLMRGRGEMLVIEPAADHHRRGDRRLAGTAGPRAGRDRGFRAAVRVVGFESQDPSCQVSAARFRRSLRSASLRALSLRPPCHCERSEAISRVHSCDLSQGIASLRSQ